jgi:ribosomal protein L17
MVPLHEMKEREYIPNRTYIKMLINGCISFVYILITNFKDFKKIAASGSKKRLYKRPIRRYELPEYKKGMKYCISNEKFLRPTLWCNFQSKEVIALANSLGAYTKSEKEYVEAAFEWVKRNLTLEIVKMDSVEETLNRGTGTCIHINNVLVALCRCAGIKARYKLFAAITSQATYQDMFDSMTRRWYDALGYFSIEGDLEILLNGNWVVAHAGPTPERQAAMNIPITTLGEEAIGIWFDAIPGTLFHTESIPYGIGLTLKLLLKIAPGTIDGVNANTLQMIERGKQILQEKGGERNYDTEIRSDFIPKFPKISIEQHQKVIFER